MFDRNVIYKNKALEVLLQAGPMGSVLLTNRRVWCDLIKMTDKSKGAESRILRVFLSRRRIRQSLNISSPCDLVTCISIS